MKRFKLSDVLKWTPCSESAHKIPAATWPDEGATALEFLDAPSILFLDRMWLVLRYEVMTDDQIREFAVWGAKEAAKLVPIPELTTAANMAEDFFFSGGPKGAADRARAAAKEVIATVTDVYTKNVARAVFGGCSTLLSPKLCALVVVSNAGAHIGEEACIAKLREIVSRP